MANELRVRANGVAGATTDNPLSSSATTMNSAGLADLPAIGSTQHAAITLLARDANGRVTAREVVYVTAHTASATSATILRGQEGTTGVTWSLGSTWVHGPMTSDFAGDTAWIAPTFQNSWVNFGGSHVVAGYRKDPAGFVHLRGLVKSGTLGSTIFTLPVGYRPDADWLMATVGGGASDTVMSVIVGSTGTVTSNSGSLNTYVSLNGLHFRAEQ